MTTLEKDLETRLAEDHHQAIKLWLRLLTCTNLITGKIRSRLRENFATTLPRFDLLAQLERHPEGLRMGELSQRMMVTTGNVTGIADQLEAEGLVRRESDPKDRRSVVLRLTPKGREVFSAMAKVHEGWVIEFFEGLSPEEKDTLYALLGRLKQHLNGRRNP
ncbi:Transcriptional activatory protein BadR [Meiothermus luteus]|jgi:DNA-binding MarR family transcriptional regulator|uniref:Transcriptional activatory protein BadR n=1 Tax=Meiothermus luteus TaxID=2026184 RepID=A0A399EU99_9DEIN|nr:MarR family transcriptional regulator [Meiothermus luteus]RIH87110.1 Transcriptional activatory protein BadR [Meiothermus luteus]RMH57714.1 MAG: MarR family transcriptional regulator [Deinococcota bacterium]